MAAISGGNLHSWRNSALPRLDALRKLDLCGSAAGSLNLSWFKVPSALQTPKFRRVAEAKSKRPQRH
jgi:hypothetical protein